MTGVSVAAVAEMAGTSPQAVREQCRTGSLPAVRGPHGWVIDRMAAVEYIVSTAAMGDVPGRVSRTVTLTADEASVAWQAMSLAARFARRRLIQCADCRQENCRNHFPPGVQGRALIPQLFALQRRLAGAS